MNSYKELKARHQKEVDEFPMAFAFSEDRFAEGMKKLGLEPTDTDKIYKLGGTGGFYRITDHEALVEMFNRHEAEMKEAIENDSTGDGFIYQMFNYELSNHEYGYTMETEDTLDALGLTEDEVDKDKRLSHGLRKACKYQMEHYVC